MTKEDVITIAEKCGFRITNALLEQYEGKLKYNDPSGQDYYGTHATLARRVADYLRVKGNEHSNIIALFYEIRDEGVPNFIISKEFFFIARTLDEWADKNGCPKCKDEGGTKTLATIWCSKCKSWITEQYCYRCGKKDENYKRCKCDTTKAN